MSKHKNTWVGRRPEQEPTVKHEDNSSTRETTYSHPAYGAITASRCSGRVNLHGSEFEHDSFIEIRIHHADLCRSLARDWHHTKNEIVSVRLSEAQWATFVSTLNTAAGTPCTIDHIQGEQMPGIPIRREKHAINEDFKTRMELVKSILQDAKERIAPAIQGLSQVKQNQVNNVLAELGRAVTDSMPFIAKSFGEHIEDTVEKAKIEIEAYMHGRIMQAGLSMLADSRPIALPEETQ